MATAAAIANITNTAIAFFLLLLSITLTRSQQPPIQLSYSSFDLSTAAADFSLANSSSSGVSQGALQITPDTHNQPDFLVNKSGRFLLKRPLTLYIPGSNTTTARLASFNTSFSINIYRINAALPGEGLAFLIAASLDGPPPNSYGQYLGLTNSSTDGSPSNRFVAVELDTVKQSFDPDDNHVGLNVNSVRSRKTASLTPLGIQIAPAHATNYTVWVDYDGAARHIYVYMGQQLKSSGKGKPSKPVLDAPLDISLYLPQHYSYLGFAASTGTDYQLNCVLSWDLSVENLEESTSPSTSTSTSSMAAWKWAVFVGLPIAIALAGGLLYYWWRRRRRTSSVRQQEQQEMVSALGGKLKSLPGTPKEFEFKVIKKATSNFDDKMKLGQGGFGVVYRGAMLLDGVNVEVAVKKFSRDNIKGQDDFLSELSIINRLRHRNLVRLLGQYLINLITSFNSS